MEENPENEMLMKKKKLETDTIYKAIKRTTQEKAEEALELSTPLGRAEVLAQQESDIKAQKNNRSQGINDNKKQR